MGKQPGFVFDGGILCLDFVNTELVSSGRRVDRLREPADLFRWIREAGLPDGTGTAARAAAKGRARDEVFATALELRKASRGCLEHLAAGRPIPAAPARRLCRLVNAILDTRPVVSALVYDGGTFRAGERVEGDHPLAILEPVAASIRDLLADDAVEHVRQCSDPTCIIFFRDTSKNHSRRWCSMQRCGARAKVATYRRRVRRARRGDA